MIFCLYNRQKSKRKKAPAKQKRGKYMGSNDLSILEMRYVQERDEKRRREREDSQKARAIWQHEQNEARRWKEEQNLNTAKEYLAQVMQQNPNADLEQLGIDFYFGQNGKMENDYQAFICFRQALMHGNYNANYYIAEIISRGVLSFVNPAEAQKYYFNYAKALVNDTCRSGDPQEIYELGLRFYNGSNGAAQNIHIAVDIIQMAADQGYVEAAYMLGSILGHGTGGYKNPALAQKYLQFAAESGMVQARRELGDLYWAGHDCPMADISWMMAGAQGDAEAIDRLNEHQYSTWELFKNGFSLVFWTAFFVGLAVFFTVREIKSQKISNWLGVITFLVMGFFAVRNRAKNFADTLGSIRNMHNPKVYHGRRYTPVFQGNTIISVKSEPY